MKAEKQEKKKKKKRQVRNGETAKLLFVFKYFLKLLSTEMKATISNKWIKTGKKNEDFGSPYEKRDNAVVSVWVQFCHTKF